MNITHISSVVYSGDGAYIIGYPSYETVQSIVDNPEQIFEQKLKPSANTFKLFPRMRGSKAIGTVTESGKQMAEQYEYEEEAQSRNKKGGKSVTTNNIPQQVVKKTPLYRLYVPGNLVLKEEYTVLWMEEYKKITAKEEEEGVRERVKEWIDVGYHTHVCQAFKIQHTHNRLIIYCEKLRGVTLRDWINEGFFKDKNKYMNSKRILNCMLQIAVGLNYMHSRGTVCQQLIPQNIFVEKEKTLKIGNMCTCNLVMNKSLRHGCVGGSPEYWSPEQGSSYESVRERAKDGGYQQAMRLLPAVTSRADVYQLGLLIIELMHSQRLWARGDRLDITAFPEENNCSKEVSRFLMQQATELMYEKKELSVFVCALLDYYAAHFKNAEDMLWCRFFDENKYESELLNNKAVGLYLSGNEGQCEKAWMKSVGSDPRNLTAQFNYSHFRRMKRIIDDRRLNKELLLHPQSRKRNYYLLISNLVMLPLLKEPFKTYNFNPKLSKQKEIEVLSTIIDGLEKCKHEKEYASLIRYHLPRIAFDEAFMVKTYFVARLQQKNTFVVYRIDEELCSYRYSEMTSKREASPLEGRQSSSVVDPTCQYMAMADNSYLCIFYLPSLPLYQVYYEMADYGSAITTMEFDQKTEVLGVGSSEFIIKLINIATKSVCKVINIGQKFIIRNLCYYDRNTCIGYSYQRAITFHRIETTKQLFTVRTNAVVVKYIVLEVSLNSHLLVAHTTQKFEIWNLKDKILIRNIEIDEAPKIEGFFANSSKKLMVHYTQHVIRIWNYSNGLILKTFRTPMVLVWVRVDEQAKTLHSLDIEGNLVVRNIDFSEFIRHFEGVCVPNEICLFSEREEVSEDTAMYIKYGRELVDTLNDYRMNEQEKKVSLQRMYRLAETIKASLFYQERPDIKAILLYLNGVKQSQDKASRINSHSEDYVFTSRKDEFITATSNTCDSMWLIGESDGSVRLASSPDILHFTIRPKMQSVCFLHLTPTSIFIGYEASCLLLERESLQIVVQHSAYHKSKVKMGLVVNNVLVTGDQSEVILFWNREKVRRYRMEVNCGQCISKRLLVAGYDNRVRLYDVDYENGLQLVKVLVGHVRNVYRMAIIDDSIFASHSYDGTIRWWNVHPGVCFSFFHFGKYFKGSRVLYVDMPKMTLQEERLASFNREGCALLLLNGTELVVFDTLRREVKWRLELPDQIQKVFWTDYPNSFGVVTHEEIIMYSIYWRYVVLKK